MAAKIIQRDAQSEFGAERRKAKPRQAMTADQAMRDTGDNVPKRGKRKPARDLTVESMTDKALDASPHTEGGNPGSGMNEAQRERHEMRKGWFLSEATRQAANRARMARCEAAYDSEQWSYEDAEELKARGQDAVVYNEIKPTIDWLIGTERRSRVDFTVVANEGPTDSDEDLESADEDAQNKTKLMKWLDQCNKAGFERSWAAEDAFKAGIGWLEVGISGKKGDAPVFVGAVPWRDMLWDSVGSTHRSTRNGRFHFRIKVVDLDVAKAIFPGKHAELERCVQVGDNLQVFSDWYAGIGGLISGMDSFDQIGNDLDDVTTSPVDMFNTRKRVLLLECWSREPIARDDKADTGLNEPVNFAVHVSIMTEHDTLLEAPSPFNHDQFPFVPVWGYRHRRTGLPYSPIWPLLGPQTGLNKRMSKSLFEANANQWEIEAGAIDPEAMSADEVRDELNDPNGMVVWAHGALSGSKVRKVEHRGKASEQLGLAEADRQTLRSMSGVTGENRGERTNSTSGKAVLAKQDQGSLLTAELFDNILYAHQLEGELKLSVAEQVMAAPRVIPSVDGAPGERIRLNQPQADGTYLNDITKRAARFTVGEQQWKQTYAEAAFETLMTMLTQLSTAAPQAVINLLDLVFDMHPNLPKKRAIVARMRSINGQADPDGKLTPEQQAEMEQKKAVAKANFEAQMAKLVADVQEAQAKGAVLRSEAVLKRLTSVYEAAQAASVLATMPELAPVADAILKSSGFEDQGADETVIDPIAPAPKPETPVPGIDPVATDQANPLQPA